MHTHLKRSKEKKSRHKSDIENSFEKEKSMSTKSKDRSDHKKSSHLGKLDNTVDIKEIVKSSVTKEKLKKITEIDMFKPSSAGGRR